MHRKHHYNHVIKNIEAIQAVISDIRFN